MELELGLKVTRTREDVSSSVDFRFSKDPFGPLVLSRETDSRFIIIIHLKGFKKEGIEIDINEEGNRITVGGRKAVEEMVMIRWMAWRKEVEIRTFKKVFRIPDVVDLDKIKARFDDDDATLTITMPKRVKGILGFEIEEERAEFGEVSEVENREETETRDVVEEEAATEVKEPADDDSLEKTQQIDEQKQDKITEFSEEETIGQHELADSDKESYDAEEQENRQEVMGQQVSQEKTKSDDEESKIQDKAEEEEERVEKKKIVKTEVKNGDAKEEVDEKMGEGFIPNIERTQIVGEDDTKAEEGSSRKLSDIEGQDSHKQTRLKEQGNEKEVMEQRVSQEKAETDDFGYKAFEEVREQEPDELDRTSTGREMEKKMTDDDGDGLRKVQGTEESKIQEVVEGEREDEKKKTVKMDTKIENAKEEVDPNMGERFAPNIAETETKAELGSDHIESDEVDKIHEVVEEKEEEEVEDAKVGTQSEDNSLIKLQETEEQHSKGPKRQETIEELVEEKTPKVETNIENDTPQPVQQTEVSEMDTLAKRGDEGKEEIKDGDAKDEIDAKMGERFTPKIAETSTKFGELVSDKLEVDEADKKEEEKENAKDIGDQHFQRDEKQEKIKEIVKDQSPKAETNLAYDTPKPVEERCEEKQKKQAGEYKEKIMEAGKKINDVGSRKVREMTGQHDLDESARCEKESKIRELVKRKTTDAEKEDKETAEMEIKERESYRPKILGEQDMIKELAQVKTDYSKDGEVREDGETAEKKTEFGDDDIPRKVQDIEQQDSDAKEEAGAEMEKGSTPSTAETEAKAQVLEPHEMDKMHELVEKKEQEEEYAKVRSKDSSLIKTLQETEEQQFQEQKLHDKQEPNQREEHREKVVETGNDAVTSKVQEVTHQDLDEQAKYEKEKHKKDEQKEGKESADAEAKEPDVYRPKILGEQDKIQELAKEKTEKFSKIGKTKEEEEFTETKREFGDGDIPGKIRDIEQHDSDAKEEVDAEREEGFTPNIAETEKNAEEFESDKVKSDEIYKTHEPVEKKEEDEENAKVRRQSADGSSMKKIQETKEQQENIKELVEEKPEAETETKEQESYKTKILREQEKSKELAGAKTKFSRKVEEEVKNAEKKTEFGDDDMSGKVGDTEQRDSDATKGQEQNDKIQELVEEYKEEIMDTDKRINDAGARKVQDLIGKQELEEPARCEKESKVQELVKSKTNDAEKENEETAETERKEQESYRPKVLGEQDNIQELVEEKTEFSKNGEFKEEEEIVEKKNEFCNDDISRKVRDVDQQRESDANEEFAAEMGRGVTSDTAEKETKAAEFESDKLEADEELGELFDKKEEENENATLGTESQDIGLIKLKEIGEQRFEGEKENPEAETSTAKDIPKPVQEIEVPEVNISKRFEGEHKIEKLFQEETDNLREECKEKAVDTEEKINDVGSRKVQDNIRQQDLDEQAKREKESKTNDEEKAEKESVEMELKEQDSDGPKILREHEKLQEIAEEEITDLSNIGVEEEIAEKKTEFSDDDMSTKVGNIERIDSDAVKGQEKERFQDLVLEEKVSDYGKGIITVAENDKSRKAQEIDEHQSHEEDASGKQFQKLTEGDTSGDGEVEDVENKKKTIEPDKRIQDSTREGQEIERKYSYVSGKNGKGTTIQELQEQEKKDEADRPEKISSTVEQEVVNLSSQLEKDSVENGEKTQELVEKNIKDREEEEGSEGLKPRDDDDDVVRKVQEQKLYEPKEVVQKKTDDHDNEEEKEVAESEIEAEFCDLSRIHSAEEQELQEPMMHKEPDKAGITEAEEPSGQKEEEKERIIESQTTTENDNFTNGQNNKEEEPDKPESHEKREKIQKVVEAGHNDYEVEEQQEDLAELIGKMEDDSSGKFQELEEQKPSEELTHEEREERKYLVREEAHDPKDKYSAREGHNDQQQEEKLIAKDELRTEKDSSEEVQEIEKQEPNESQGYTGQEEMQETEEKYKTRAMKKNDIVERSTKPRDGSLKKVGDDEDTESRKSSTRLEEEKIQEPVEMGTIEYREKFKKQEEDDILRIQEVERPGEQSNIPQLVEEEKRKENMSESGERMEDDSLVIFQKQKLNESWRQEEGEELENFVKEEAGVPKDKHTGREGENEQVSHPKTKVEDDIYKKALDNEEREVDKQLDNLEGVLKEGASDLKKDEENLVDDFTGKIQETEKQDSHASEMDKKLNIVPDFVEDKTDAQGKEKAEEAAAVVSKTENRNIRNIQMIEDQQESEKHGEQNKVLKTSDPKVKEENEERVGEKAAREQEAHEMEMHRISDIVQASAENETWDQEDEKAEGAAAVVAKDETKISRKVQTTDEQELEESEKYKEQNKISETSDPEVKEEDEERVAKKYAEEEAPNSIKVRETKEKEAHVQELEGKTEKTEDWNDDDGEGSGRNEGRQGENVENVSGARFKTGSDAGILRNTRETSVQEPKDKKDQELEDKTKELETKETSKHEVKLIAEDDSLREGHEVLEKESSNVSKRRPMDQGKIQELKKVEKGEEEEEGKLKLKPDHGKSRTFGPSKLLELDDSEEKEELKKIREPMEENRKGPEKENDKFAKEKRQEKIDSRTKDQEMKRQEPYELQKNRESEKIPEYHREEEKGMEERQIEEMYKVEDVRARKVQQIGAEASDRLEKHRKLTEKTQEPEEEEMNDKGECKAPRKTKSMEDSCISQDVEEKGLMVEEERREIYDNDDKREKEEQKNKTERILQAEPKADSRKSETEEQELTREKHQEVLGRETSNQRKEEEEDVGKGETAEYDRSCKIQDDKKQKSDKLERHGEQEMAEEQELAARDKEQDKKKASEKKDIVSQAKQKEDQEETRTRDDSQIKIKGKGKREFDEQKRNEEQEKNLGLVGETTNENQEYGKGDKETADAYGMRKLKEIEERDSNEVRKHENPDDIQELREGKMIKQEEEDNESTLKEFEEKSEDHELTRPVRLKELEDGKTAGTETRFKDSESRNVREIEEEETSDQRRLKEQERTQSLVEDRTSNTIEEHSRQTEYEDGSSKKIQVIEKEESVEAEKRDKIQEPVNREISEDDSEELEVEVEDSEEDWEAEVIHEMDSDESNDKIRQIRKIKLGFRLVGGSALFMSLIVIVIRFIRSKKKIRCYK